nr:uncharacterized protein LOC111428447 [Onthophagus taurus]
MAEKPEKRSSLLNAEFQSFYDLRKDLPLGYSDNIIAELAEWENKIVAIRNEYRELEETIKKTNTTQEVKLSEEFAEFTAKHFKTLYDSCDVIRCYIAELRFDKEYEDYRRKNIKRRLNRFEELVFEKFQNDKKDDNS